MDRDDSDPAGPFEALQEFVEALRRAAEQGDASGSGSVGDRARIDFDYSVRTGLGPASPARDGHPQFERSDGPDLPARVAADGDERVVTVDLGDHTVRPAAVSATVSDGHLRIAVDGETRSRVDVGDGPWQVERVTVNNGIVEARVVGE